MPEITWRRGVIASLLLLALALALWAALTAPHSHHRALDDATTAFDAVHMTARDPARLASFYGEVFDMPSAKPHADVAPMGLAAPMAVLQLPGYGSTGPLLTLSPLAGALQDGAAARGPLQVHDHGYAHICFEADDVYRIVTLLQAHGGAVLSRFEDLAAAPVVYAADPEGNAIEIHIPLPEPVTPWTLARTLASGLRTYFKKPAAAPGPLRFLHVNLNVPDWRRAAALYQQTLGGEPTGMERHYVGEFIGKLIGVAGAEVHGRHVALPGYSPGGPTFEIFTYNRPPTNGPLTLADAGRVATSFRVSDLSSALARWIAAGGQLKRKIDDRSALVSDADGNLIVLHTVPQASGQPSQYTDRER